MRILKRHSDHEDCGEREKGEENIKDDSNGPRTDENEIKEKEEATF